MFKNQYIHTSYFKTKNDTVIWGQFQEPVYCGGKRPMTPNSIQTMTDEKVNQIFHSEIKNLLSCGDE